MITLEHALASTFGLFQMETPTICGGTKAYARMVGNVANIVGCVCHTSMREIIAKLISDPCTDFTANVNVVVIPQQGNRGESYIKIEVEALQQERVEGPLLELMDTSDPREIVDIMLGSIRDCAVNHASPSKFKTAVLRAAVVSVVALQWTNTNKTK